MQQRASPTKKIFPYTTLVTDSFSLYPGIKLALAGLSDYRPDGRPRLFLMDYPIDTSTIRHFFESLAKGVTPTNEVVAFLQSTKGKAEIILVYNKNSSAMIVHSLTNIVKVYLSFQQYNALQKFQSDLCALDSNQVDSLRRNVPLRLRLVYPAGAD